MAKAYFSLTEKIRKSCNDISVRDLNKDDGLDTLVREIKSLYVKDKFENFNKRLDDVNIVDYINRFESI